MDKLSYRPAEAVEALGLFARMVQLLVRSGRIRAKRDTKHGSRAILIPRQALEGCRGGEAAQLCFWRHLDISSPVGGIDL